MARMRSLKPEYWDDQELAESTSRDARLLYPGLWNLADEHGRLRGDPRHIKGALFPYDDDLDPLGIDKLLDELVAAGKVVRYRVKGAGYLFLPNLGKHQRLEPDKVPSRLPGPDDADPNGPPPFRANRSAPDPDESVRGTDESAQKRTIDERQQEHALDQGSERRANKSAPRADESALACARLLSMEHVAGGMEHVAGTRASPRAAPPPDDEDRTPATAQTIVAEWIDRCPKTPPRNVIGQIAKHVGAMLDEGIDPDDVRRGVAAWMAKRLHPSTLPSVVNEVMNGARASPGNGNVIAIRGGDPRPSTTDARVAQALAAGARVQAELDRREVTP